MRSRNGLWGLLAGLGLLAAVVAACGGSTSSSTGPSNGGGGGGSSGAVVQGQIVRSPSARLGESAVVVVLRTTLGIGLAEAAAGEAVANTTVTLSGPGGTFTTQTSAEGNFIFTNVPGGSYTITVAGMTLDGSSDGTLANPIVVGAGDTATLSGTATQTAVLLVAHVDVEDVSALLQNTAQLCHAVSIASATGKNLQDIINTRLAGGGGHGWGKIAKQFGAPPSVLGNNACTESQIANAAAIAGGNGKGNGKGTGKGKGKGKGNS